MRSSLTVSPSFAKLCMVGRESDGKRFRRRPNYTWFACNSCNSHTTQKVEKINKPISFCVRLWAVRVTPWYNRVSVIYYILHNGLQIDVDLQNYDVVEGTLGVLDSSHDINFRSSTAFLSRRPSFGLGTSWWYYCMSPVRRMAPKFSSPEFGSCQQIRRHS